MATGRSNYLTKQAGEYIVAAELSRRGFIATTFTGNVPSYDIVAVDEVGGHALVQVKAIAAASWQLNVGRFAHIDFHGRKQVVRGQRDDPYPGLICVMVRIAPPDSRQGDQFFILPWRELGRIVVTGHEKFLAKHGGIRPRSPESLHTAVQPEALARWKDRWDVITKRVRPTSAVAALPSKKRTAL